MIPSLPSFLMVFLNSTISLRFHNEAGAISGLAEEQPVRRGPIALDNKQQQHDPKIASRVRSHWTAMRAAHFCGAVVQCTLQPPAFCEDRPPCESHSSDRTQGAALRVHDRVTRTRTVIERAVLERRFERSMQSRVTQHETASPQRDKRVKARG